MAESRVGSLLTCALAPSTLSDLVGFFSEEAVEVTVAALGLGRNAAFRQLRASTQPGTTRSYVCVVS